MSQLPPFNPPPPGFGPPPGSGGIGSQQSFGMPQQPRTSASAVTSLVCGIICCTPITAFIAIICGIVGIRATANPMVRGRGMAITGLILGILGFLISTSAVTGAIIWWVRTAPERDMGRQYLTDLSENKIDAALAESTSDLSHDDIQDAADQVNRKGAIVHIVCIAYYKSGGYLVQCTVQYKGGTSENFFLGMVKQDGVLKVDAFSLNPGEAVNGATTRRAAPATR